MYPRPAITGFLLLPVVLSLLLAVSGCAPEKFYTGEKRPADQVSIIEVGILQIFMIDENPVSSPNLRKFQVLPGEHTILATVKMQGYNFPPRTYTFRSEGGHRYLFDVDYRIERGLTWKGWIKDLETGELVAKER